MANVALQLLRNDAVHQSMSEAAADIANRRTWEMAAMDVEAVVAELGG